MVNYYVLIILDNNANSLSNLFKKIAIKIFFLKLVIGTFPKRTLNHFKNKSGLEFNITL